jgi:site-specific DNA-methyltransferase (adenine-specific)
VPHRVIHADCLELLPQFDNNLVTTTITDPPYNIGGYKHVGLTWSFSSHTTIKEVWDTFGEDEFLNFNAKWLYEICRITQTNGNLLIFASYHNLFAIGFILQQVLKKRINQIITWYKPNAQPNITGRLLHESCEYIIWAVNNTKAEAKNWYFDYAAAKNINRGKQLRNIWEMPYAGVQEKEYGHHPTQKPQEILERLITIFTPPGAHVLDPFAGSGTTAVACKKLNREYTVIEQRQEYVEIIKKRLECSIPSLIF